MPNPSARSLAVTFLLLLCGCGAETDDQAKAGVAAAPDDPAGQPTVPGAGSAPASREPQPGGTTGAIECTFYYRKTNEVTDDTQPSDLQFTEETIVLAPNEEDTVTLGNLELFGAYAADEFEGDAFHLRVSAGETWLFSTLYQLSNGLPVNQFAGDHGFTGLMYLTHPTQGGDYQLICKAVPD